jgi:hypothetical protein
MEVTMISLGTVSKGMSLDEIIALVESAPLVSSGHSGLVIIENNRFYVWNFGNDKYGCQIVNQANSGIRSNTSWSVARYLEAWANS